MANDKQQRADEMKKAQRNKPVRRYSEPSVGMGTYSDRIAIDPSAKVQRNAQRPGMARQRA